MASVLNQYSITQWRSVRHVFITSWKPASRFHGFPSAIRGLGQVLRRARSLDVIHVHLSERGSFIREGVFLLVARLLSLKTVATLHGAGFPEFATRHPSFTRSVLRLCDRVIVLGQGHVSIVRGLNPRVRVDVVPNPQVIPTEVTYPVHAGSKMILMAGEIGTRKGVDRLLSAWPRVKAQHPEARLILAGPLGDISRAALSQTSIEYVGNVAVSDVARLIREATLCCLPSRNEVMPMFILESLALGRPVVTTPVGVIEDLADTGAVILTSTDASDLDERLIEGLANSDDLQRRAHGAKRWLLDHVDPEVVAGRLETIYREIIQ